MLSLALFPLNAHILPNGRLKLRIFEQRYVRMVKESFANDQGFCMAMVDAEQPKDSKQRILPIVTRVKVIDFENLPDGMLGITIEGIELLEIIDFDAEADGLLIASLKPSYFWHDVTADEQCQISQQLKRLFKAYPEVSEMYERPKFDDKVWVVARWLELLPLPAKVKQDFVLDDSVEPAFVYLNEQVG